MVVIKSATYGDAYSSTDVLGAVSGRVKDGSVALKVDSSLIPFIDKATDANTVTLSNVEKREINDVAVKMCDGPSDQVCLEIKTRELAEAKLKQKQEETTRSTSELIAGKYLTVEYQDDNGRPRKVKIPEGQEFKVGEIGTKTKTPPLDLKAATGPLTTALNTFWASSGYAILTFLYVSSILVTWMTVRKSGSRLTAYGLTAASAIVPYSGFFIAVGGPAVYEFYRTLRERYAQTRATMDVVKNPLTNP